MKQFEIKISTNLNMSLFTNLINRLKEIGCVISEKNGNINIKYENHLESKVKEYFDNL